MRGVKKPWMLISTGLNSDMSSLLRQMGWDAEWGRA